MLKVFYGFILRFVLVSLIVLIFRSIGYSQRLPDEHEISISFTNVPIDIGLLLISTVSGINISYDPTILPSDVRRTISTERMKVGLILDDVLYETDLVYKIVGHQLIIVKRPKIIQYYRINGFVEDIGSKEKLVYANILSDNQLAGGSTNEYGYYSLVVPEGEQVLRYSYLGYEEQALSLTIVKDTNIN